MIRSLFLCVLAVLVVTNLGCKRRDRGGELEKDYERPLAAGEDGIVRLDPVDYPRFTLRDSNRDDLLLGIERSLNYLGKPSAKKHFPMAGVSHQQVTSGLEQFKELLASGISESELNAVIKRDFLVYSSVGWDKRGTVLFTGYYTPIFEASLQRTGKFRYPLYKRPDDLVGGGAQTIAQQKMADGSTRTYPTRKEIEQSKKMVGQELVWLSDAFEAYVVQVQGSAMLRLRDGSTLEVGYAGTNGHEYTSIGMELIHDNKIEKSQLSLDGLRNFFRQNPHFINEYTWRNDRYVFFQETKGGPFGSLGEGVVPDVSIATDKSIFPRGALTFVTTGLATTNKTIRQYHGFRLDHDTGGAIRAPGRCDLYMGTGADAERRAGYQLAEGRLYYIIAK